MEEITEQSPSPVPTPQNSRKNSGIADTVEETTQDRGIILEILKDPEIVENIAGCCVHFLKSSCCSSKREED
jgi:hypothetical protein